MFQTNKLFNIADFAQFSDTYIETGLAAQASLNRAIRAGFRIVKSVEVFEKFYNEGLEHFRDNPKVQLYFGESSAKLSEMLSDVKFPAVIFLDAHPAGPSTGGHDDLMEKGDKSEFQQDLIITRELNKIFEHSNNHLIIIDDMKGPTEECMRYIHLISGKNPHYQFHFYDEQLEDGIFYPNKILVCIP